VKNALGEPQTVVLLGGTSDIGLAIVRALVSPATRTIVLAARRPESVDVSALDLGARDVTVDVVPFDAVDTASHQALIDDLAARHGDIDVVIVAFGQLGEQADLDRDAAAAAALVQVNFAGAVSASMATAARFREQGHGQLVILSSVAGERVRKANFVYGSTKAGLDGFAQGLGDSLAGSGASVLVVRPGFVHSSMTAGMKAAPLATTPDAVAAATVEALRSGRRIVWVPGILRLVFAVFRHLPSPVWRRLKMLRAPSPHPEPELNGRVVARQPPARFVRFRGEDRPETAQNLTRRAIDPTTSETWPASRANRRTSRRIEPDTTTDRRSRRTGENLTSRQIWP
jgi:decaprenylphospho-beta-D-erythro-pentofuranosid-2-ulose 2-reductase